MLIFPYLSALIWLPIVGGFFLLLSKKKSNIKMQALLFSVITFIISLGAFLNFHVAAKGMQLVEDHSWIAVAGFKANYYLGIDGISLLLILLTTLMTTLVVIAGWTSIKEKVPQYFAAFLIWVKDDSPTLDKTMTYLDNYLNRAEFFLKLVK